MYTFIYYIDFYSSLGRLSCIQYVDTVLWAYLDTISSHKSDVSVTSQYYNKIGSHHRKVVCPLVY